ncbi:unnamed protein product [Camellia sinensis]
MCDCNLSSKQVIFLKSTHPHVTQRSEEPEPPPVVYKKPTTRNPRSSSSSLSPFLDRDVVSDRDTEREAEMGCCDTTAMATKQKWVAATKQKWVAATQRRWSATAGRCLEMQREGESSEKRRSKFVLHSGVEGGDIDTVATNDDQGGGEVEKGAAVQIVKRESEG